MTPPRELPLEQADALYRDHAAALLGLLEHVPVRPVANHPSRMPQVKKCGARPRMATAQTQSARSDREIDVLLTPADIAHVIAVDRHEVGTRDPESRSEGAIVRIEFGHAVVSHSPSITRRQDFRAPGCIRALPRTTEPWTEQWTAACAASTRSVRSRDRNTRRPATNQPRWPRASWLGRSLASACSRRRRRRGTTPGRERTEIPDACETVALVRLPGMRQPVAEGLAIRSTTRSVAGPEPSSATTTSKSGSL